MAEVAILGAGCAGLAAAARLARAGIETQVLEARGRTGGRVATQPVAGLAAPVELGAEFVHGPAPRTLALVARAGIAAVEIEGRHLWMADGRIQSGASWERVQAVLRRMDAKAPIERTFAEELARLGDTVDARDRERLLEYVRGYHAADPARASARAIIAGELEESPDRRQHRLRGGQRTLVDALAAELPGNALRLSHRVDEVSWRSGSVRVRGRRLDGGAGGEPFEVQAAAAVVALPAAVLQAPAGAGGVAFDPPLAAKRAPLVGLGIGSVLRAVFQFDTPWWHEIAPELGFLHTPGPHAPVWWTAFPGNDPLLVGWAGGTQARSPLAHAERADRALSDLARHLGRDEAALRKRLVGSFTHDWDADPFARGAYTYPLAGSDAPWRALAEPLADTLFFAGEACDAEGRLGTVEAAIATGERAGEEAISVLRGPGHATTAGTGPRGRSTAGTVLN